MDKPFLTGRQLQTVQRIMERELSWMVGWSCDDRTKQEAFAKAALKVVRYIKRIKSVDRRGDRLG